MKDELKRTYLAFKPLKYRAFGIFWSGALISSLGFWVQNVAQGWQVLQLSNSAFLLGLTAFAVMLPNIFLAPFGGVIADRIDRRLLLICTQSVYMVAAALLALLTQLRVINTWHIIVLALLYGIFSAVNLPAWQAFPGDLLPTEQLNGGVALMAFQWNLTRVTGPAIGGLLVSQVGVVGAYTFNAISYLAVIIPLLFIPSGQAKREVQQLRFLQGLREGWGYVGEHRLLKVALFLQFVIAFLVSPFVTVLSIFARNTFKIGPTGLGLMNAAVGVGAFVGSALLVAVSPLLIGWRYIYLLIMACIIGGITTVIFALSHIWSVSLFLLLAMGLTTGASLTLTNAYVLKETPLPLRSRAVSIWVMLTMGLAPLGNLTTGWFAQATSATLALVIQGAICALLAGCIWFPLQTTRGRTSKG